MLIADGIFAFRPENNRYCDFRIWLDVNPETPVQRAAQPHPEGRIKPAAD